MYTIVCYKCVYTCAHVDTHTHCYYLLQAVWALGNIAGDDVQLKDRVLDDGILDPLLPLVGSNYNTITMVIITGCTRIPLVILDY